MMYVYKTNIYKMHIEIKYKLQPLGHNRLSGLLQRYVICTFCASKQLYYIEAEVSV